MPHASPGLVALPPSRSTGRSAVATPKPSGRWRRPRPSPASTGSTRCCFECYHAELTTPHFGPRRRRRRRGARAAALGAAALAPDGRGVLPQPGSRGAPCFEHRHARRRRGGGRRRRHRPRGGPCRAAAAPAFPGAAGARPRAGAGRRPARSPATPRPSRWPTASTAQLRVPSAACRRVLRAGRRAARRGRPPSPLAHPARVPRRRVSRRLPQRPDIDGPLFALALERGHRADYVRSRIANGGCRRRRPPRPDGRGRWRSARSARSSSRATASRWLSSGKAQKKPLELLKALVAARRTQRRRRAADRAAVARRRGRRRARLVRQQPLPAAQSWSPSTRR